MELARKLLVLFMVAFALISICQAQGKGKGKSKGPENNGNGGGNNPGNSGNGGGNNPGNSGNVGGNNPGGTNGGGNSNGGNSNGGNSNGGNSNGGNSNGGNSNGGGNDNNNGEKLKEDNSYEYESSVDYSDSSEHSKCEGRWEQWGQWTGCDAGCGNNGTQTRSRRCVPLPNQPCAKDHYQVSCGKGKSQKWKKCKNECIGKSTTTTTQIPRTTLPQNRIPCATGMVQGEWGVWSCWSTQCNNGLNVRYRQCDSPWPAGTNMYCKGSPEESKSCYSTTTEDPSTPRPCVAGQDVIFAVDSSGSIGSINFNHMTNSLLTLIASFPNKDYLNNPNTATSVRAGILTFSSTSQVVKELNNFTLPIDLTYSAGGTETHLAIELAENMFTVPRGDRIINRNVLAVLTDGASSNRNLTVAAASQAKNAGIKIIAVGIGSNYNEDELKAMVSNPITDVYNVTNFSQLGTELTNLFGCI